MSSRFYHDKKGKKKPAEQRGLDRMSGWEMSRLGEQTMVHVRSARPGGGGETVRRTGLGYILKLELPGL